MLSFIVTYRDRADLLLGFIQSLRGFYPTCEIVVAEQTDAKQFVQGQLFNLAYPHSHGDIVILMDVDIRLRCVVDFHKEMYALKHPFIGYDRIFNCDATYRIMNMRPGSDRTHGGCCVFTRKQFEVSSGYSNLLCGWGAEDDILDIRVGGFERIHNTVLHIWHEKRKDAQTYSGNRVFYETEYERNKKLDGFRQTTGNLISKRVKDNVIYLAFDKIGVIPDFIYSELIRDFLCQ